jgi:hypothetical protein
MDVKTQTVEQFLFEQLDKIAPGKIIPCESVLQQFKSRLRFPCSHLKGGGTARALTGLSKDYNLSIFTFPTGVTEIKCLYNCGLKIRSDEKELKSAFSELYDLPSSNTRATSEVMSKKVDPGPVPYYTDAKRQSIRESTEMFWRVLKVGLDTGRIKPTDLILGAVLPHPDPIEAPDSIVERGIKNGYKKMKSRKLLQAVVVVQDRIPEPKAGPGKPIKIRKAERKARKTQSRQRKRSGK